MSNYNNKNIVLLIGVLIVGVIGMVGFKTIIDARERQEEMMEEIEELKEKNEELEDKDDKEELIKDNYITVPDVEGMSVSEAVAALQKEGFYVADGIIEIESNKVEEGKVVKTNPPIGSKQKKDTAVSLYISKGLSKIIVEDYTGRNYLEVKATLETLGIIVTIECREGSSSSDGTIIMQSVNKGSELKYGDSIILYVAKEIPKYPDFTDGTYTVEDVKEFCNEYGVTLNIQNISHKSEAGTIVEQSRKVGYTVVEGTTLTIKVSTGN